MKNLIVASTSTIFGGTYLSYLMEEISIHFKDTNEIIFIPYARPGGISYDQYTTIATEAFSKIEKKIIGLHTFKNPEIALKNAKAVFVGGGNTFVLVKQLYTLKLMRTLKEEIIKGLPYLGTSAGSNICGLTMNTTNDMPIVYPPSFKTFGAHSFPRSLSGDDPCPADRFFHCFFISNFASHYGMHYQASWCIL